VKSAVLALAPWRVIQQKELVNYCCYTAQGAKVSEALAPKSKHYTLLMQFILKYFIYKKAQYEHHKN
jgi:hypothetical protein